MRIVIIHGAYGSPKENWFPWLKAKLEKMGHGVSVPQFPTPEGQTWENWRRIAQDALKGCVPADTILIGHSIGVAVALRLAELAEEPYKAVFAISPFARDLGLEAFDKLNQTFVHPPLDWHRLRQGASRIVCLAGDNDPYVPLALAQEVALETKAELVVVPKGGHLNAEAGFVTFPLLLDKVREVL